MRTMTTTETFPASPVNRIEPWITTTMAGAEFGVTGATVRRWIQRGCPHGKVLKQYRVKLSEVRRWLDRENEGMRA